MVVGSTCRSRLKLAKPAQAFLISISILTAYQRSSTDLHCVYALFLNASPSSPTAVQWSLHQVNGVNSLTQIGFFNLRIHVKQPLNE